jgi:hypothetical protein
MDRSTMQRRSTVRPFTPRKRSRSRAARPGAEKTLQQILAGLDDAHRRELETMLEDRSR